jgi:hypothetical protein
MRRLDSDLSATIIDATTATAAASVRDTSYEVSWLDAPGANAVHVLDRADGPRTQRLRDAAPVMQRVKAVTSYAAAYAQRWWCGPDSPGQHIYAPGSHALTERDPARISARLLIAAGRSPARVPTCEHALLNVPTTFYHLVAANNEDWFKADGLRHDLRFDEWQDDHDTTTRSLRKMWLRTARVDELSPVLARALSLFGPGELRALRVLDVDVCRLITSLMRTAAVDADGDGPAPQIEQATDALCAVEVGGYFSPSPDIGSLAAVLERHASTITEIRVDLNEKMLKQVSSAVAGCTRLESLTRAYAHDAAIWLGLSHLHTLRGVDLSKVSTAAIAAGLPKLHTLEAFGYCRDPAQAEAFCTDVLSRLRVFHFEGQWPNAQEPPVVTVAPLPLLEELAWNLSNPYETIAPHELLGAQPMVLDAPYALISRCQLDAIGASASFLGRVRKLFITTPSDGDPLDPADVARVLRAAPQLKKFFTAHRVHGDASWLAPTALTHPAFERLVHPRLQEFGIVCADGFSETSPPDAEWVAHLRRRHFPRLRELVVGDETYFVTPPDDRLSPVMTHAH